MNARPSVEWRVASAAKSAGIDLERVRVIRSRRSTSVFVERGTLDDMLALHVALRRTPVQRRTFMVTLRDAIAGLAGDTVVAVGFVLLLALLTVTMFGCGTDEDLGAAPVGSVTDADTSSGGDPPKPSTCEVYQRCADQCGDFDEECAAACASVVDADQVVCEKQRCNALLDACAHGDDEACAELPTCADPETTGAESSSSGSSSESDSESTSGTDGSSSTGGSDDGSTGSSSSGTESETGR